MAYACLHDGSTQALEMNAFLLAGLSGLGYFLAARLGFALAIPHGVVTLWPPSGLMLGILLTSQRRNWPAVVIGGVIGSLVSDLYWGHTLAYTVAAAGANATGPLVAAWLLTRLLGIPVTLDTLRAVLALTVGAVVCSNAVTSVLGAPVLQAALDTTFAGAWLNWWVGAGLGMLVVTPVVLTWTAAARRRRDWTALGALEALVLLTILSAGVYFALGPTRNLIVEPRPYFSVLLLVWAALRLGPAGAATGSLVVAAVATWNAAPGEGPFAAPSASAMSVAVQVYAYVASASVSSLILAAVLEERKAMMQQLRATTERYRTVVETATDAIVTIDPLSTIEFANPATERIFGYTPEELVGRELTILMPPSVREQHKAAMAHYLAAGKKHIPWQAVPLTGLHKSGREIPLEVSFGELVESSRHVFTGILRDVTEKRTAERTLAALEEQYRQSQKMEAVGQLAGGVAHDFNSLLTVIQGYCELLIATLEHDDPHRADIAEIQRAAERAASLTRQLLAFSRRQILTPRVVDLSESVRAIEPMLRRLIGEQVVMVVSTPGGRGHVRADPGQIEQVILNLALNARDAMPKGGRLLIEVTDVVLDDSYAGQHLDVTAGPYVMLAVSDTGLGMDAETLTRIFEPFFTTKPKGSGTGLGLSTVHGIVKQSGGHLLAHSEPARGTTLKVYLPRVDASVDLPEPVTRDKAAGGSETLLLLEDDDEVRRLAERVLVQHGYRVLVAATPMQALAIAGEHAGRIHLLLSDVVLPGMSGRSLADHLLSVRSGIHVLFMSGYTDDAIVHDGILDPGTSFIQKPFTPEALIRKVRQVLDRRLIPPASAP
jgi:PAS domain S-box-containing protein